MIPARRCLVCGGEGRPAPARIAPFIAERCGIPKPLPAVAVVWCPACDFAFFDHRFDGEETRRLYAGYRDEAYNRQRLSHEPYYHVIRELVEDQRAAYRADRIRNLRALFPPEARFGAVLDYGGEADGWLARGAFPEAQVAVYDLSFPSTRPARASQDLVICSNVFEHVAFPLDLLAELKGFLAPGGLLCLEVPLERPRALAAGPAVVHEHISFFSPEAVLRMLARGGLRPLDGGRVYAALYGVVARAAGFPRWPWRLAARGGLRGLPAPAGGASAPEADPLLTPAVIGKVDALAQAWKEQKVRLVLAPAGQFVRGLLEHTRLREADLAAVCDRDPARAAAGLPGLPVLGYEAIVDLRPDIILVASPEHETDIVQALRPLEDQGRRVLSLARLLWP